MRSTADRNESFISQQIHLLVSSMMYPSSYVNDLLLMFFTTSFEAMSISPVSLTRTAIRSPWFAVITDS